MLRHGRLSSTIALLGCVAWLWPTTGEAKRKRPGARRGTVAVFPLAPNPAVPEDIRREFDGLMHGNAQAAGLTVLAGVALDHRLRESASGAIALCRGNAGCVAKLSKRLRADEVVYATANVAGDNVTIAVFVVAAGRARIDRKASFAVAIKEEVEDAVAGIFPTIFKLPAPGAKPAADPLAAMGDLDLEPLAGADPLAAADPLTATPIAPPPTDPVELSDPLALDSDDEPPPPVNPDQLIDPLEGELDDELGPSPPGLAITPPPPAGPSTPWLMVSSIAVGGLGVVAAGTGGGFGIQSLVLHNRATPRSVPQRLAADRQQRSEAAADRANMMYLLAGTMAVVAGVMLSLDLFVFDQPGAAPTPSGASIFTW